MRIPFISKKKTVGEDPDAVKKYTPEEMQEMYQALITNPKARKTLLWVIGLVIFIIVANQIFTAIKIWQFQ